MDRPAREAGFALAELLAAVAILGMVAAAILGVFQVSLTQLGHAFSLQDAQSTARSALDRISAELRLAGAYWTGASGAGPAIMAATPSGVTFVGDVDGDTVAAGVETTLGAPSTATALTISGDATAFAVYADATLNDYVHVANGSTREVRQVAAVAGTTVTLASALTNSYPSGSVVRSVETVSYAYDAAARSLTRRLGGAPAETLLDNVSALVLNYFDSMGTALPGTPPDPGQVKEIQIRVTTEGAGGDRRTMVSRVSPRN